MKKRIVVFLIIIFLVFHVISSNTVYSALAYTKSEELSVDVVFIGYDATILNLEEFRIEKMYDFYYRSYIQTYNLIIRPTIISWQDQYFQDFITYVNSIADFNATTSSLNASRLYEDNIDPFDGIKSDIFNQRSGIAINATQVQNYLWEHPPISRDSFGWNYGLYFLNLSILDRGSTEHWYDISEKDMDTNSTAHSWYSGYRGLVDRPVAGWGGEGEARIMFFDPSALKSIWYDEWMYTEKTWQNLATTNNYIRYDLEDYIATHETFEATDNSLEDYMFNFFEDILWNNILIVPSLRISPYIEDYYFEIAVIDNLSRSELYTRKDLDWIVQESNIKAAIEELLPFFNIKIKTHWYTLENLTELQSVLDSAIDPNYTDTNQIEVTNGVLDYLSTHLESYVDSHPRGMDFPTIAFLMNNSIMSYNDLRIGGLGGMGWQLIGYTETSLFNTSGSTSIPRNGISDVIIHEAGHSLGFSHPHTDGGKYWAGDFVDSIMSYYVVNSFFSKFEQDWLQSVLVQQILFSSIGKFESLGKKYNLDTPKDVQAASRTAEEKLLNSWTYLRQMNFIDAFYEASKAREAVIVLSDLLMESGIEEEDSDFHLEEPKSVDIITSTSSKETNQKRTSGFIISGQILLVPVYVIYKRLKSMNAK